MIVYFGRRRLLTNIIRELHQPKSDVDNDEDLVQMPGGFPSGPGPSTSVDFPRPPGTWGLPHAPVFRVGFAGRGAPRGGFQGHGRGQ
jgi:SCF-associated factor 1